MYGITLGILYRTKAWQEESLTRGKFGKNVKIRLVEIKFGENVKILIIRSS